MEVSGNSILAVNPTAFRHNKSAVNFEGYNCLPRKLKCSARELCNFGVSLTWLLQPIGDGDSRHIGYKIALPAAFQIASDVVTVGRLPEKADVVISVPTVSGLHAEIRKTEKNLLITDLESTNGTFIDERRLQPGVAVAALPGNLITFGDTNLAVFRVCKFDKDHPTYGVDDEPETSQTKPEDDDPTTNVHPTT